jgi:hypothetical protein
MLRLPARLGMVAALCLFSAVTVNADDAGAPQAPVTSLALKDGRVLHNVKIMSDEGASVVVRSDEGLFKVSKAILPPSSAAAYPAPTPAPASAPEMVMQRFDPNQAPEAPPPEPGAKAKPAAKPGSAPKPVASATFKGCSIISFQIKSFQSVRGCAEVVIRNDTDQPVILRPGEISCTTSDGAKHMARNIITDAFPPAVKRRESVPARSQVDDIFAFANEPLAISSVEWSR